jgi:hypothetical protein
LKTLKNHTKKFLVLVPHQDVRLEIKKHACSLPEGTLAGVYPFPIVAPLAALSQPLTPENLKQFARTLRGFAGEGKISANGTAAVSFPTDADEMALFGIRLDLNIPAAIFGDGSKEIFSPPVIGTWLIPKSCQQQLCAAKQRLDALLLEKLSFRAAAIANMSWQPVLADNETAYEWKIDKLCWLPKTQLSSK